MVKRQVLFGFILFATAGAWAVLPPDAEVRKPELRAHATQVRKEYEERLEKRRELATRQYEQATADIGVPPWELKRRMNGEPEKKVQAEVQQAKAEKKKSRKQFLVSILLLVAIGSIVGWVKHKTPEVN